jgi:hypothetical protein
MISTGDLFRFQSEFKTIPTDVLDLERMISWMEDHKLVIAYASFELLEENFNEWLESINEHTEELKNRISVIEDERNELIRKFVV